MLPKVIYRFMIKIAGSASFEASDPEMFKKALEDTADKNKIEIKVLLSFIMPILFSWVYFFQPYTMRPFSIDLLNKLKKALEDESSDADGKKLRENIEDLHGDKTLLKNDYKSSVELVERK